MRIVYLYLPGRLARLPDLRAGRIPTEFFYGAPELEAQGHDVKYVDVHDVPAVNKLRVATELLFKQKYLPAKVYFAILLGVKKNLPAVRDADVVIATVPGIAFSLAIWNFFRVIELPRSFIAIHCGLFNYPQNGVRQILSRRLFCYMRTHLFGEGELKEMKSSFRIPAERIEVNCFGVDEKFWSPSQDGGRDDYILAVGNDSRRDYKLLVQAARNIDKKIMLLTKRDLPPNLPDNVKVLNGSWHTREVGDDELRELYRKAFCVVVPLTESIQPSGQSVTLQAMACCTPVILTRTQGLWENKNLQHRENILFTEVGNIQTLIDSVRLLGENKGVWHKLSKAGRQYILQYGCIGQFAGRIETACKKVLENE